MYKSWNTPVIIRHCMCIICESNPPNVECTVQFVRWKTFWLVSDRRKASTYNRIAKSTDDFLFSVVSGCRSCFTLTLCVYCLLIKSFPAHKLNCAIINRWVNMRILRNFESLYEIWYELNSSLQLRTLSLAYRSWKWGPPVLTGRSARKHPLERKKIESEYFSHALVLAPPRI